MTDRDHLFTTLSLTGVDAASFMQGYVTADLDEINDARAQPVALTDIKGRVTGSGWLWGTSDHINLIVHQSVAASIEADLAKYLLFSKSRWQDGVATSFVASPASTDAVALPPTPYATTTETSDVNHSDVYRACVTTGMIIVTATIAGRFLPQSLGLTAINAVSFTKGCYLGQEIVARAEHRGQVKIGFGRFTTPDEPLATGTPLYDHEKSVGTVLASTTESTLVATRHTGPQHTEDGVVLEPTAL